MATIKGENPILAVALRERDDGCISKPNPLVAELLDHLARDHHIPKIERSELVRAPLNLSEKAELD
ncbi:MAG: hypothetical protein L0H73_04050 [Nitrococcus sp.]|nr:hypothetical protein [Nitrococcus sp.]